MAETQKHKHRFTKYLNGIGIDIGFGGDPVSDNAITLDLPNPYTKPGKRQILRGDASNLSFICDNAFDYVYSSHLIEDFVDTYSVIKEWLRILKPGGYLCLLFPDEKRYREIENPLFHNMNHKHLDFGLEFMLEVLSKFDNIEIIEKQELFENNDYNCMVVCKKIK